MNNKQKNIIQNNINFDSVTFNIEHYNIQDLEKLFGVSANKPYKREDIEQNEYSIIQKLINDNNINNVTKQRIITFYGNAKKN